MVKIQSRQEVQTIDLDKKVKLVNMGQILEVMSMETVPENTFGITKIDKDRYMVNDTGEIFEYKHTENRTENVDNLRRTFKQLRYLINYNFQGFKNELAFTITYGQRDEKGYEILSDPKTLYKDFERFIKRLRYEYKDIDYLNVVEPHGDGVWHCHVLLRFNGIEKIYIPNKKVADLWGQGFVTVKAIKQNVDNLGAYLSAYLGDIELNDKNITEAYKTGKNIQIKTAMVDGKEKKFIKGGRLHYYPTGMRIYRKSKGIKEPPVDWLYFREIKEIVGSATPNYSKTIDILDESDEILNTITYYQYNLKRGEYQR